MSVLKKKKRAAGERDGYALASVANVDGRSKWWAYRCSLYNPLNSAVGLEVFIIKCEKCQVIKKKEIGDKRGRPLSSSPPPGTSRSSEELHVHTHTTQICTHVHTHKHTCTQTSHTDTHMHTHTCTPPTPCLTRALSLYELL